MPELKAGDRIFKEAKPMELLYLVESIWESQIWRVRDIFSDAPQEYDELFEPHVRISYVHSKVA